MSCYLQIAIRYQLHEQEVVIREPVDDTHSVTESLSLMLQVVLIFMCLF